MSDKTRYRILHIPTGTYYTSLSNIPSFVELGKTVSIREFRNIKETVFAISRILNYCKNKPACFVIDTVFETMFILQNELEIIEVLYNEKV